MFQKMCKKIKDKRQVCMIRLFKSLYNHRCGLEVTSLPLTQGPGFDPRSDQFPSWGFAADFPSTVRQMSGNLGHIRPWLSNGHHIANGYPQNILTKKHRNTDNPKAQEKPTGSAIIPYAPGISEKLRRIGNKYGIRTAFRSCTALRSILTKTIGNFYC